MTKQVEQIIADSKTYLCPCGSGLAIIDCCVSRIENTIPKAPKTGFSHPKCYAKDLNDCSSRISGEHFLSRAIQDLIAENRKTVIVQGAGWLSPDKERVIPITSLSPNILCERHNSALSGLDSLALKFFTYIYTLESQPPFLMVNGNEIERWMLKVLCGYMASGWHGMGDQTIPNSWIKMLFETGTLSTPRGLYVLKGKDITARRHQFGQWTFEKGGQFYGMHMLFSGFQFLFMMETTGEDFFSKIQSSGWEVRYRPECLVIVVDGIQRELHLGTPPWDGYVVFVLNSAKNESDSDLLAG